MREIQYCRHTKQYKMILDGAVIGYADTYLEAETRLDEIVYANLTH